MRSTLGIACLTGLSMLLFAPGLYADTQKFAVVIGNNLGHDPSKELRFAEQDARKLRDVLVDLGGFKPEDVELVLNRNAAQAWAAVERMEARLDKRMDRTGSKALLLLYFSGHAEGDVLELGASSLRFDRLLQYLRSSSADVRLAFLDSCQSGRLIAAKGGRRGPGFDIHITDEITSKGYAIITSSAHDELSQESVEIHGAFFTHYLVSALRGAGDKSGDGRVTLDEAYQYAYSRTLARTSATIGASQHPMYEFELQGRGEIVLTNTDRTGTYVAVTLPEPGRLMLLDESENGLVAEAQIHAGETAYFAVRPGSYRAYLLAGDDAVRYAEIDAVEAQRSDLGADDFQTVQLATSVPKGGLFSKARSGYSHRLGGGGVWRKWPLEDAFSSYGATLHYRFETPSGLEPASKLTWTTRPDVGLSSGYHDVGLMIGAGYLLSASPLLIRVQLLAGYEQLIQEKRQDQKRTTPGFDYLLDVGLELPLEHLYVSLDTGAGGRVFEVVDKGVVHRIDFQVVLSLGVRWIDRSGGEK